MRVFNPLLDGGMEIERLHAAVQVAPWHTLIDGSRQEVPARRSLQEAIGRILIGNLGDAGYPLLVGRCQTEQGAWVGPAVNVGTIKNVIVEGVSEFFCVFCGCELRFFL